MKLTLFTVIIIVLALTNCRQRADFEVREDFKKYFNQYGVEGSFSLFNQNSNKYIFYNKDQFKQEFLPASTFKICNSLIGLETGVIKDAGFIIRWDSVDRGNPNWNHDQDLRSAYKNSAVWYYQELARRVGRQKMKFWLDKTMYGNADTSGGIDRFWLYGGLRISPEGQINFLRRLHDNMLPFSKRSMDIVKDIMIVKDTLGYVLRAKTGWARPDGKELGWFVGYIEENNNVYYFASCIQTPDLLNKDFGRARTEIAYSILKDLSLVK